MEKKKDRLDLTEDLFIGKGAHKAVYRHPHNTDLCVKLIYSEPDVDLERELHYRKVRDIRNQASALLPRYYGTVATNQGTGYIFERVCDYDGMNSITLKDYLSNPPPINLCLLQSEIVNLLKRFKGQWFQEKIVTSDVDPANFLVQKLSAVEKQIRIVDNIGTPVIIPLAFYFDYFADKRFKRYWRRFVDRLALEYPDVVTDSIVEKLL